MLGIYPPAAETVVAVPQTVKEDDRDVRAGVLHSEVERVQKYSTQVKVPLHY